MPDVTKQTVSASEVPAILNKSPYATRWMMFHKFANGMDVEVRENDRLSWGKRLEPVILRAAADELRADVLPHDQAEYLRSTDYPIGCTPDGYTFDPQLGLGFVEVKNIDYMRWRDTWDATRAADHVEIQLQTQMMVRHPEHGMPKWGCIAALVGGNDLLLYRREPIPAVQEAIAAEAKRFLADVQALKEPEILGIPIEVPALALAYPFAIKAKTLTEEDFSHERGIEIARLVDAYMLESDRASYTKKQVDSIRAQILAALGDAGSLIVHGRMVEVTKSQIAGRVQEVKPYVMTRYNARLLNLATDLDKLDPPKEPADDMPSDIFA